MSTGPPVQLPSAMDRAAKNKVTIVVLALAGLATAYFVFQKSPDSQAKVSGEVAPTTQTVPTLPGENIHKKLERVGYSGLSPIEAQAIRSNYLGQISRDIRLLNSVHTPQAQEYVKALQAAIADLKAHPETDPVANYFGLVIEVEGYLRAL